MQGNAFGFLGSYSWTILASWVLRQIPENEDKEDLFVLMTYFFNVLSTYNWAVPISIVKDHSYIVRPKQDQMPILTSVKPYYNSARNVTISTATILQREFHRANTILHKIQNGNASWSLLFEEVTRPTTSVITLVIKGQTAIELEDICGWVNGHIVGLIISIEALNAIVRPYPTILFKELEATIYLGLESIQEKSVSAITTAVQDFIHSFDFDHSTNQTLSFSIQ